jgi:hypothetical protein
MPLITRREAIRRVALLLGGAALLPDLLKAWEHPAPVNLLPGWGPGQDALIAEIAERIIPTTDTPGAKAAGVPDFILKMIADCTRPAGQEIFRQGLDRLETEVSARFGRPFVDCSPEEQTAVLREMEQTPFFQNFKRLTVLGYFTSETGCTQALRYEPLPGRYEGDLPYKKGDKAWAT